ncbi:CapA family protein [Paenibacillus sp. 1011MAR3C5]|uniref:CapA family protein n=1 Tax=Paenibacillus sp. 1011MAR3C5 TaxID=1675787 RepID=UPI000E6C9E57|nr:CapA family protein [Paenibacillus sp. 1011MAR3C5]RJE90117.1 CapA family protein [Paenibacillus sp. 1011MAR3C5]
MRRKTVLIPIILVLSVLSILIFYLLAQTIGDKIATHKDGNQELISAAPSEAASTPPPTPEPTPVEPVFTEAVWVGVGDIMSHYPQLPGAYDSKLGSYDFNPFFAEVKDILGQGDWIMANLETPIAGADFGYSGYPTFNAPYELAEALKNAGFNLLSTANNHSLDKGERGLLNTLQHLKELDLQAIGTASSQEEADALILAEQNGIRMGLLAYTYGTNGIPIPQGKPYLVNLIDEEKIKADIARLKDNGADLVTVALHFGNEYQTTPSESQKSLARSLVAAGADIIAGSHPHVIQPYEVIEGYDDNGNETRSLIIYSMGNFISNQRGDSKDYGVIFKVGVRKNVTEQTTTLTDIEAIPTWVHRYKPDRAFRYRILPVEETLAARNDSLLKAGEYDQMQKDFDMLLQRLESMK